MLAVPLPRDLTRWRDLSVLDIVDMTTALLNAEVRRPENWFGSLVARRQRCCRCGLLPIEEGSVNYCGEHWSRRVIAINDRPV